MTTDITQQIAQMRELITQDLSRAQQLFAATLQPGASNVFVWFEQEFWVDRVRRLIVPAYASSGWRSLATLPSNNPAAVSLLEVYGSSVAYESTGRILDIFAWLACGLSRYRSWAVTGAHILNLAVAQPSVNPAFSSLFWLALAEDAQPGSQRDSVYELVGPMIYELMSYPDRSSGPEVRCAQIEFVERLSPGSTDPGCERLTELEWTARCAEQLEHHRERVDYNVFDSALSRAGDFSRDLRGRPGR